MCYSVVLVSAVQQGESAMCVSVAQSCPTLCNLWSLVCQAPLSMGIECGKIELSDPYFCKLVSETELGRESSGPADTLCEIADLFFTEQNWF